MSELFASGRGRASVFQRPVNQEPSRAHLIGILRALDQAELVAGGDPEPSVVNVQFPMITRSACGRSGCRRSSVD